MAVGFAARKDDVYRAAELVIGNLNEDGYLTATEDELLGLMDEDMGVRAERLGAADAGQSISRLRSRFDERQRSMPTEAPEP